ncbi:MAG: hypothetical protein IJ180_00485 [Bacteroidales bacterium]|nr:hypothetical protein [Bacteroidales bacterium]
MMFDFRLHKLQYLITSGGYEDEDGNYIQGDEEWSKEIPCRYELNQRASTITLQDGVAYTYTYVVYLNLSAPDFHYGQTIRLIRNDGIVVDTKEVKGFTREQLHCRLWL